MAVRFVNFFFFTNWKILLRMKPVKVGNNCYIRVFMNTFYSELRHTILDLPHTYHIS